MATKKRVALLRRTGKILMDDVPFVPLYNLASIYGASKNLAWKMRPAKRSYLEYENCVIGG